MLGKVSILIACVMTLVLIPACGGDDEGGGDGKKVELTGMARGLTRDNTAEKGKLTAVIDEYYAAMKAGDVDRMFKSMGAEYVEGMTSQMSGLGESWKEVVAKSYKEAAADLNYEVLEEDFKQLDWDDEQRAKARVKAVANGEEDEVTFTLVKRDDKWLIYMMESRNQMKEMEEGLNAAERDRPKDD